MDMTSGGIECHLPVYLSQDSKTGLKKALETFANTRDGNIFSTLTEAKEDLLQGDVWASVPVYDYSSQVIRDVEAILLSNTCDMTNAESRATAPQVTVAPVMKLKKYEEILLKKSQSRSREDVESYIKSIRSQHVTNLFYLPDNGSGEKIAHLNRAFTLPVEALKEKTEGNLATLNMLGFYIFIFKLSVHFCRLHEGVDRD